MTTTLTPKAATPFKSCEIEADGIALAVSLVK